MNEADEPGALNYEWFISPDGAYCHLVERYANSAATVQHLKTFREQFAGRFMGAVEVKRYTVYGRPYDEAAKALGKMGARMMEPRGGLAFADWLPRDEMPSDTRPARRLEAE